MNFLYLFKKSLTLIAKGVRNITGIYFKGFIINISNMPVNVGQDIVESVFSLFIINQYQLPNIVQTYLMRDTLDQYGFINFGWRGWEGELPTSFIKALF